MPLTPTESQPGPSRIRTRAQFGAVMGLVAMSLLPMLASGFFGDDEISSITASARFLSVSGQTLSGLVYGEVSNWVTSVGRFFPLGAYGSVFFWLANGNPLVYKAILMVLVLLDAGLLYAFVRRLTSSSAIAAVSALMFSLTLQFRSYHEPILAFTGLLPVITALVLTSLLLFINYLESGSPRSLVFSVAAFAATLLIYEVALPMCLLFTVLALVYPQRSRLAKALRASWSFLAAAGLAVANVAVLRLVFNFQPTSADMVSGYQPSLSPVPFVVTLVKQIVAAFPLTYYGSRMLAARLGLLGQPLYASPLSYLRAHPYATVISAAAFFVVGLLVLRGALTDQVRRTAPKTSALVLVGLGFLVLPNTLIAVAPRHQMGVAWGQGYLPVYMSAVGAAMLATAMIYVARDWSAIRRHAQLAAVVLALLVGTVGAVNFDNNRLIVEAMNRTEWYPPRMTERAASEGLLSRVPDGAIVLSNIGKPWQDPDFYRLYAGKSPSAVVPLVNSESLKRLPLRNVPAAAGGSKRYTVETTGPPVFYLYIENSSRAAGYALLSRVQSAVASGTAVAVTGTPLVVYRTWQRPPAYDWPEVYGWPKRPSSYRPIDAIAPAASAGRTIASGDMWVLQTVSPGWTVTQAGIDADKGEFWTNPAKPEWYSTR